MTDMSQTLYYAHFEDEVFGPFSLESMREMHLLPDVSVLTSESNEWRAASEFPELVDSLDLNPCDTHEEEPQYELWEEEEKLSDHADTAAREGKAPSFNKDSVFYILRGENPYGPYSLEALATVGLDENTSVSLDGKLSWHKVREIPGLINTLAAINSMNSNSSPGSHHPSGNPDMPRANEDNDTDRKLKIGLLLQEIKRLVPDKNGSQPFTRVFKSRDAEFEYIVGEYNKVLDTLLEYAERLCGLALNATLNRNALTDITSAVNKVADSLNSHYRSELDRAKGGDKGFSCSFIAVGHTDYTFPSPFDDMRIRRMDFLSALGAKNLILAYDKDAEDIAGGFIDSMVGRLYECSSPRSLVTYVIDSEFMTGLDDSFKLLSRELYKVVSRDDEIRDALDHLKERAGSILRNLLVEKGSTLRDYNNTHENKEARILLVLKNFPMGLSPDDLESLGRLANVGPKTGIYIVVLSPSSQIAEIDNKDDKAPYWKSLRESAEFRHFRVERDSLFDELSLDSESPALSYENMRYDVLSGHDLLKIVKAVNAASELRQDIVIPVSDYLPDQSEWWRAESARQIEIPFGLGGDLNVKSLRITQESGQNSAVVIGIPGSGKSVFLHTLICSAALRYSPDELRMYLIDFSGVEFNSYAVGALPHARVIAPEAEREFGLSVLNELVEEGSRRMALCREHNVSNIVDLKHVAHGIKVPRLLVIIDEFQKLFEVDNDPISREANSKIHIIIQEFRKFGINLVLATQKLPTSSFLPRDLIANRIVFKSAPADYDSLIMSETREGMPRLRTGQCVYNSESGAPYANEIVQGFFTSRGDIDSIMSDLREFERGFSYVRESVKVFRSADLPDFSKCRRSSGHMAQSPIPYIVPVYFGESIAVSDVDVSVELVKENANNILVAGGESDVARDIAFNAMRSAVGAHTPGTARIVVLNGMRPDVALNERLSEFAGSSGMDVTLASSAQDIESVLRSLREEIELRRNDENLPQQHIYVTCFDFQSIRVLDKDISGSMPRLSAAAKDMDMIVRQGSSAGIFVIAQTDTLDALNRISQSSVLPMFNFRVALQMPEDISYKLIGTPLANRLFVFNRPASRFRGYVRDNARNQTIKFKPYK